jgi:hypothetical protein
MTWLFSKAMMEAYGSSHSSPEPAAEYSEENSLTGEPYAQLNVMPTPHKFWRNDKTMEFSKLSQFGLTLRLLTVDHGEALLTSYLAAFRARTLVPLGKVPASEVNEVGYGAKWPESLVKYCQNTYSWRTHHCLWDEVLPWSSVILPRWGMTLHGVVYQHPTSERPINETVSGLWPTPVKSDALVPFGHQTMERKERGESRPSGARIGSQLTWDRRSLPYVIDGRINPILHQWLMGWPIGWTSLQPLEMDKFLEWQQQHSIYSEQDSNKEAA